MSARRSPYMDLFAARVLTDALNEATPVYWSRRAQVFRDAAPKPGDFNGNATVTELAERTARCLAAAEACLNNGRRIQLIKASAPIPQDVWYALDELV